MDELVAAAGAESVDWPFKTECCGASLSMTHSAVVSRLAHRLLCMAREAGADCLAVACPLCQVNLDLRQADAGKAHGPLRPMPVLYVTQLLGLALGLPREALGIDALDGQPPVASGEMRCRRGRRRGRERMTPPELKSRPATGSGGGNAPNGAVLVCGGGVAGIQASLDLSAAGFRVFLVEESPTIGGGMARLDKTFPTGDCATCIISPKLVECMRDYNVDVMTMADVTSLEGEAGRFTAEVRLRPRGVVPSKCTGCGDCWQACPVRNVPQSPPAFRPSEPLADDEKAWIDGILARYHGDPGPLIPDPAGHQRRPPLPPPRRSGTRVGPPGDPDGRNSPGGEFL